MNHRCALCFLPSLTCSPAGKTTPVSMTGDPCKPPPDPFQPFGVEAADPFQSKKTLGDPFSGKDPFAPFSATSNPPSFLPLACLLTAPH